MVRVFFLDSSALVKRYIHEVGSGWVQGITEPRQGHQIIVSRLAWVEVMAAFARLRREERIEVDDNTAVTRLFQQDFYTQYQVVEFDHAVAQLAGQLTQRQTLRAYDSVQLASAVQLKPAFSRFPTMVLTFVAADKRLLSIAQDEGLAVANPIEQ